MKKLLLYLLLFTLQLTCFSQDTVSIYFDVNKSKLTSTHKQKLDSISYFYENIAIDSIYFIGMADSVGNIKSNLKLSEKRARTVKGYFSKSFLKRSACSIFSIGEENRLNLCLNRRVDIILFYQVKEEGKDPLIKCKKPEGKTPCFKIEYNIVNNCFFSEVKKGRRTFVKLESNLHDSLFVKKQYSGAERNGEFFYRRIRWKTKSTGKFWWRKKRRVALILKKDYEKYKIFTIVKDSNCVGCYEDLSENLKIENETTCKKVEYNLMTNSQYKYRWFKPNEVKVRTPKEYIDLNKTYFESCDENKIIDWKTKKYFGRKKYYYSKVRVRYGWVSNISSIRACCDTSKLFDCSIPIIGVMDCHFDITDLMGFRLKSGVWHQEKNSNYYLGASYLYATKNSIIELTGAYLFENKAFSALSYDYNFLYLPGNLIKSTSWSGAQKRHVFSSYFSLYAGTEIQTILNPQKKPVLSQDVHLGISFQTVYDEFFAPRLFIQHGLGNTNAKSYFSISTRTTFGISFLIL